MGAAYGGGIAPPSGAVSARRLARSAVAITVRASFRKPRWALLPVATLAVGICAATTILTLMRAIEVDGLPYPEADRLTLLTGTRTQNGDTTGWPVAYLDFLDWRERVRSFEGLAVASDARAFNLAVEGDVERVQGEFVAAELFSVLGLRAELGTLPASSAADPAREADRREALSGRVVVSHAFWQRWFGSSPDVLGSSIRLNERLFTVRAVLEPGFRGVSDDADVWIPIEVASDLLATRYIDNRAARWLTGVARLSPGSSLESARQELSGVVERMAEEFPDTNRGHGVSISTLAEAWFGDLQPFLFALLCGAVMVFLIGAANVGGLMLVRASSRSGDAAIMTALGAEPADLALAGAVEGALVGVAGWLSGFGGAVLLAQPLIERSPLELRGSVEIAPTLGVGLGTLAGVCLVMAAAGAFPILAAVRVSTLSLLGSGGRSIMGSASRSRQALVVAEIALALILLAGAGVLYDGLQTLRHRSLGFAPAGVLAARLDLKGERFRSPEARVQLARSLVDELNHLPDVSHTAVAGPRIPGDDWFGLYFVLEDPLPGMDPDEFILLPYHAVTQGYFDLLGIPLVQGRDIELSDDRQAALVAVVSQRLAAQYWPDADPVGKRLKNGPRDSASPWVTVVGVVGDVEHQGLSAATRPGPDLYLSAYQVPPDAISTLVRVRSGDPYAVAERMRAVAARVAPGLPLFDIASLQDRLDGQTAQERFAAGLMTAFAVVALLLSAMGLYGLVSYAVTLRTREIGTRLALGAQPTHVILEVVRSAVGTTLAGVVLGAACTAGLRPFFGGLVRETPAVGTVVLIAAGVVMMVAMVASYRPARTASRVAPMEAWR